VKRRKVEQNPNLSAVKVDGDKELLGRPRKKTNVADAKGKVRNQDMVQINKWDPKVSFLVNFVSSICCCVSA
jgi:hypothetical protein